MSKPFDYSGLKFGHLTLLHKVRSGGHGVGQVWKVKCECGREKDLIARRVLHGRIKSCGNRTECPYSRDLARGRPAGSPNLSTAERYLFTRYMKKAINKGVKWDLSPEQFHELIGQSCTYCGTGPSSRMRQTSLRYNSIALVDSSTGYTQGNVMSLCRPCAQLQAHRNAPEFLGLVLRIASYVNSRTSAGNEEYAPLVN